MPIRAVVDPGWQRRTALKADLLARVTGLLTDD